MFTGLIEATGTILKVEQRRGTRRITIAVPPAMKLFEGCSVSVSGVCLTAVELMPAANPPAFTADLAAETVARTSLAELAPGSLVNLELPAPAGSPLGGHIVQGHVDGVGRLMELAPVDPKADPAIADRWLRVALPEGLGHYVVEKGSIAIEGISLTVAHWYPAAEEHGVIEIAIIPHTYARTNLHALKPGRQLNLEADVMLKFFEQRRSQSTSRITAASLIANGF